MLSKKLLPVSVECAVCSKFGDFICERCGETYCSKFCQVSDWREHRRFCMPIPRLMQRGENQGNGLSSDINVRMLMDANASFDATDAIGSISEHSALSDTQLTTEQITKITSTLNKMQLEPKHHKLDLKSNLSEIVEVMSTPPATPVKKVQQDENIGKNAAKFDENANLKAANEIKQPSPKPRVVLSPPPKKQKNFRPSVKVIQSDMHVTIVYVDDENYQTVFVVPTAEIAEWKKLIDRTQQYASVAENLKKDPEVGYIVLAKPKSSDSYSRGLVKKVRTQDKIAKVEFLEYGFTDIVKFSDMKCLTEELVNASRLVNTITLTGAPDKTEHVHAIIRFLRTLQENQTDLIVKHPSLIEKTSVCAHFSAQLIDTEKFTKINDQINDLVALEPQQNAEIEDITEPVDLAGQKNKENEIEFVGFNGQNLELYVLDNSFLQIGCFSAIQTKDMALLGKNDSFINEKSKEIESARPFHPRNSETCLAQSDDDKRWYRASAQNQIDHKTYNLMYIDYGNMEPVPIERIREMREEFFFPCITSICFIDGLNDVTLSGQAVNRLKQLIQPYSTITFEEVRYTGEDALCKSNKIMDILKNERLI